MKIAFILEISVVVGWFVYVFLYRRALTKKERTLRVMCDLFFHTLGQMTMEDRKKVVIEIGKSFARTGCTKQELMQFFGEMFKDENKAAN